MGMIGRTLKKILVSLVVIFVFASAQFIANLDDVIGGETDLPNAIKNSFVDGANAATKKAVNYLGNTAYYFGQGDPIAGIFYGFLPFILIWGFWYLWISIFFDIVDLNKKREEIPHSAVMVIAFLVVLGISLWLGGFENWNSTEQIVQNITNVTVANISNVTL